jgi:hypothetical protein
MAKTKILTLVELVIGPCGESSTTNDLNVFLEVESLGEPDILMCEENQDPLIEISKDINHHLINTLGEKYNKVINETKILGVSVNTNPGAGDGTLYPFQFYRILNYEEDC